MNKSRSTLEDITEDGILRLIISFLTLREAVRTCVLSPRWRHIWTYLPKLNFDFGNVFDDTTIQCFKSLTTMSERCSFLLVRTNQFIRSVNSVLQLHQGLALENFSIRYSLNKAHSEHLDAWVRFAVSSKTKWLTLYLDQYYWHVNVELYEFPFHLLGEPSIQVLFLACCTLKPTSNFEGLLHLKSLVLWDTQATKADIHLLLSNCSALEKFGLVKSKELVVLSIPGSLSKLRQLTVKECYHLRRIEVDAINLNYIYYMGSPVKFVFRRSLHIEHAKIILKTEGSTNKLNFYLNELACNLPLLQSLILNISGFSTLGTVGALPKGSHNFAHLKRLEWDCREWTIGLDVSHQFAMLLDVAPCMEELKLHLSTRGVEQPTPKLRKPAPEEKNLRKLMNKLPKHPHSHLTTVEISGFYFEKLQLQVVLYFFKNATRLELMTLVRGQHVEVNDNNIRKLTREAPTSTKLVIL